MRYSLKFRAIASVISAAIAWQPVYGKTSFSLPGANTGSPFTIPNDIAGSGLSGIPGRGSFKPFPGLEKGSPSSSTSADDFNFSPPQFCKPKLPTRLPKFEKITDHKEVAPIVADLGPCDEDKVEQCTIMLKRSVENYHQAIVGLDESRDSTIVAGSNLQYQTSDVNILISILAKWNDIKDRIGGSDRKLGITRTASEDEDQLKKIVDSNSIKSSTTLDSTQITTVSRIHLTLSEELVVAAEASYNEPFFAAYASSAALLASLNPSAYEAFTCLMSYKKSGSESKISIGKRSIVGYFSGNKYAEIGDNSNGNIDVLIPSIIAFFGGIAYKLGDMWIAYQNRLHDSEEREKDRALEREKAGLPPKPTTPTKPGDSSTTVVKTTTTTTTTVTKPDDSKNPKILPKLINNPDPKDSDPFGPFVSKDFDSKDNKHYDTQSDLGCPGDLGGLDAHDPKKHPELVTDYGQPDFGADGNPVSSDLLNWSGGSLVMDYENPIYALEDSKGVVSLEDFRKDSPKRNIACEKLGYASPN